MVHVLLLAGRANELVRSREPLQELVGGRWYETVEPIHVAQRVLAMARIGQIEAAIQEVVERHGEAPAAMAITRALNAPKRRHHDSRRTPRRQHAVVEERCMEPGQSLDVLLP